MFGETVSCYWELIYLVSTISSEKLHTVCSWGCFCWRWWCLIFQIPFCSAVSITNKICLDCIWVKAEVLWTSEREHHHKRGKILFEPAVLFCSVSRCRYLINVVDVRSFVRPVVMTLLHPVFRERGQHDDDDAATLPHHLEAKRKKQQAFTKSIKHLRISLQPESVNLGTWNKCHLSKFDNFGAEQREGTSRNSLSQTSEYDLNINRAAFPFHLIAI